MPIRTALLLLLAACATPPLSVDPGLPAAVLAELRALPAGAHASVWLSAPLGEPAVAVGEDEAMPSASAIKVAYLVELFAEHAEALDAPFPLAEALPDGLQSPAIAHLPEAARQTAIAALTGASVRRIGEVMIRGNGVDNTTYNVAANLVTAHFGGPQWLEVALRARDPRWRGLAVQRYMLADRVANGDNEATARSLAAVHGGLAAGSVPGVDPRAVAAARAVLAAGNDERGRAVFQKGGDLDSEPVTRVRAGWREGPGGAFVHVVMLRWDGVPAAERAARGDHLAALAVKLERMLVDGVR
jgi:hypothetical protein